MGLTGHRLPVDHYEKLARILFCCDNPPGTEYISGAQDAIGIVFPGLAKSHYEGAYWPTRIDHCLDGKALDFVEPLYLKPLGPRHAGYGVLSDMRIDEPGARCPGRSHGVLLAGDPGAGYRRLRGVHAAGVRGADRHVSAHDESGCGGTDRAVSRPGAGWKLSGAGGGGYLILVADRPIEHSVRIVVRREGE